MGSVRTDVLILERLRENAEELEKLYVSLNNEWGLEDTVYRFYHGSFKVYRATSDLQNFWGLIHKVAGEDLKVDASLTSIVEPMLDKKFDFKVNQNWDAETRPIIEALFHVKYFIDMMYKYSKELGVEAPSLLPSGWASVLYLFGSR